MLGTGSSASLSAGTDLNHPGPLLVDWLALPARLFGGGAGLALGIALLNGLAVIGIAVVAYRRGGPLLTTVAMAIATGLCWAMGSELLFEPWQPHSLLLPFLCFLMLVWSLTCGDLVVLPWAAGVGSFILQTHLSYGLLVPVLGAWAVLGLLVVLHRHRRRDPGSWPGLRRRALRAAAVAGLVLAVCWAQPLVEQFTSDGPGNLTRLARIRDPAFGTIGYGRGARILATVVSVPPWWLRPSFSNAIKGWQVPSPGLAAASLSLLAVVLAACAWDARRRGDREAVHGVATAAVALVGGLATAGRVPFGNFGIPAGQYRWLWPLAAFVWFAVIVTLVRRFAASPSWSFAVAGTLTLVTVVVAAANLPTSNQGTNVPSRSVAVARRLVAQLQPVRDDGPVQFQTFGTVFDPYGPAVVAELRRLGVPFVVGRKDQIGVRQFGRDRRFRGEDDLDAVVIVVTGDLVRETPLSSRRVALVEGLTTKEQRELEALKRRIGAHIRSDGLLLNERGQQVFRRGDLPSLPPGFPEDSVDPAALFRPRRYLLGYHGRDLEVMVREDLLVLDEAWARRFERYADLQERWDNETAAVFLRQLPLPPPAPEPAPVDGQSV